MQPAPTLLNQWGYYCEIFLYQQLKCLKFKPADPSLI